VRASLAVARRLPLEALGVDPRAFGAILELKLLGDLRRPLLGGEGAGSFSWGVALLLFTAWVLGLLVGAAAVVIPDPGLWMLLAQTIVLLNVATVLVAVYGPSLQDVTDLDVLAPLPVDARTFFAVRLAHVLVHATLLAACLAGGLVFVAVFLYAPWGVLVAVPVATLASAYLAAGVVGLALTLLGRLLGPRHSRRFALALELAMTALAVGGLHALARLVEPRRLAGWTSEHAQLLALWPPTHAAALYSLATGEVSLAVLGDAALTLALPLAALGLATALASRRVLADLSRSRRPARRLGRWAAGPFTAGLGRIVGHPQERALFDLAAGYSRRDATFLRVVVPILAMMLSAAVAPFTATAIPIGFSLYLLAIVVPAIVESSRHGQHPEAAWLTRAAPLAPESALAGQVKGLLAGIALPYAGLLAAVALLAGGYRDPLDVLIALVLGLAIGIGSLARVRVPHLARVRHRAGELSPRNLGAVAAIFGVTICVAGVHALARLHPGTQAALALTGAAALALAWRSLSKPGRLEREREESYPGARA
jgi:hypothetical protein